MARKRFISSSNSGSLVKKHKPQAPLSANDQSLVDYVYSLDANTTLDVDALQKLDALLTENTDLAAIERVYPKFITHYYLLMQRDDLLPCMYLNDLFLSLIAKIDSVNLWRDIENRAPGTLARINRRCNDSAVYSNEVYFAATRMLTGCDGFLSCSDLSSNIINKKNLIASFASMRQCEAYKYACSEDALLFLISFFQNKDRLELPSTYGYASSDYDSRNGDSNDEDNYDSFGDQDWHRGLKYTRRVLCLILQLVYTPDANCDLNAAQTPNVNAWDLRIKLCKLVLDSIFDSSCLLFYMMNQDDFLHLSRAAEACGKDYKARLIQSLDTLSAIDVYRIMRYNTKNNTTPFIVFLHDRDQTADRVYLDVILPKLSAMEPIYATRLHYLLLKAGQVYGYTDFAEEYYEDKDCTWYDYRSLKSNPPRNWHDTTDSLSPYQCLQSRMLKLSIDANFFTRSANYHLAWYVLRERMLSTEYGALWDIITPSLSTLSADNWQPVLTNTRAHLPLCLLTLLTTMAVRGQCDLFEVLPKEKLKELADMNFFCSYNPIHADKIQISLLPIMEIVFHNPDCEHFKTLLSYWSDVFNNTRDKIASLDKTQLKAQGFHPENVPKEMVYTDALNIFLRPSDLIHTQSNSLLFRTLLRDSKNTDKFSALEANSYLLATHIKLLHEMCCLLDPNSKNSIDHKLVYLGELDNEKRSIVACSIFDKLQSIWIQLPLSGDLTATALGFFSEHKLMFCARTDPSSSRPTHTDFDKHVQAQVSNHLRTLVCMMNNALWSNSIDIPIDLLGTNWEFFKYKVKLMACEPETTASSRFFSNST